MASEPRRKALKYGIVAIVAAVVAGVGGYAAWQAARPAPAPTPTPAPVEKPIKVAAIYVTPLEEPWNTVLHESLTWAQENLGIEYVYSEKVDTADAERVAREFIDAGVDVLFTHSWGYHPVAIKLGEEFPDLALAQGSGPTDIEWPPNIVLYDYWIQDAAYLAGMAAGMMTKGDQIGVVTAYAVPDVNRLVNGYIAGAKSVNPNVKASVVYLESWFDPVRAKEAARAMIDGGVDFIYAERFGVFEAIREADKVGQVYAFGNIVDQSPLDPEVVLASIVWDLHSFVELLVEMAKTNTWQGGIYDWGMKEGWAKLVWNEDLKAKVVPKDVLEAIEAKQEEMLKGEFAAPIYEDWVPERWE
ncbi:BMP family protein [Candidatus Hecatella orcuttiae]|uniref:BMP family lipoprotein n=1 Tax=Candidatus Hecatella orcuttiae TaxID=1935119 RepID=UPI0028680C73|nr:BMP family protein [Candidatus Hecatella orcuttiae]